MSYVKEGLSSFEIATAGAFSGFVTRFSCQPLDVLKILFQLQVDPKSTSKYPSMIQTFKVIVKEEGVPALWKGHVPAQYLSVVFGAIQFSVYENLMYINSSVGKQNSKVYVNDTALHFFSGSVSGIVAATVSFPFDTIRTRLIAQTKSKQYKGMFDAARQIWIHEGVRGFFQGLLPACTGISVSAGLLFGFRNIYNQIWNSCLSSSLESFQILSVEKHLVTGLLAGISAKSITYPFDLVKKRLQIQGMDKESLCLHTKSWQGVKNCVQSILKCEGFLGLYKGILPSMIKSGVANSIYFTVYNETYFNLSAQLCIGIVTTFILPLLSSSICPLCGSFVTSFEGLLRPYRKSSNESRLCNFPRDQHYL